MKPLLPLLGTAWARSFSSRSFFGVAAKVRKDIEEKDIKESIMHPDSHYQLLSAVIDGRFCLDIRGKKDFGAIRCGWNFDPGA